VNPERPIKKKSAQRQRKRRTTVRTVHIELIHPSATKVCVAGTFNDWKPETGEMKRLDKGRWVKNLALRPGTYEYRLVVDGRWMPDPRADHAVVNVFGERNSLLTVS
jgi:1,4-alpha-glucan branching enzyme